MNATDAEADATAAEDEAEDEADATATEEEAAATAAEDDADERTALATPCADVTALANERIALAALATIGEPMTVPGANIGDATALVDGRTALAAWANIDEPMKILWLEAKSERSVLATVPFANQDVGDRTSISSATVDMGWPNSIPLPECRTPWLMLTDEKDEETWVRVSYRL